MKAIIACLQLDASYVNVQSSVSQWKKTGSCAEKGIVCVSSRTRAMSFHRLSAHTAAPIQTHKAAASASPRAPRTLLHCPTQPQIQPQIQHPAFIDSIEPQRALQERLPERSNIICALPGTLKPRQPSSYKTKKRRFILDICHLYPETSQTRN